MLVARIFAESASDAAPLAAHLHALGYTIELASPDSDATVNADLEIRLERCNLADALTQAKRRASEVGADIYVAANALEVTPEISPVLETSAKAGTLPENQGILPAGVRDPLSPAVFADVAVDSQAASQAQKALEAAAVPELVNADVAKPRFEPATPQQSLTNGSAPAPQTEIAPQAADPAATPASFREQVHAPAAVTGKTPGQEAASSTGAFNSAVAAIRNSFSHAAAAPGHSLAAAQQKLRWSASAVAQSNLAPKTDGPDTIQAPEEKPAGSVMPPVGRTNPAPASRARRPLPWLTFAASGAVAVAVLLTWSVVAGHPAAPTIPVNGNIEQQIPFGAVKIHPLGQAAHASAAPATVTAKPPITTASRTAAPSAPAKPVAATSASSRPAAPAQKARSQHRTARRRSSADDDVVVHHYGKPAPPPTKTQISSTGVKHISDQQ